MFYLMQVYVYKGIVDKTLKQNIENYIYLAMCQM